MTIYMCGGGGICKYARPQQSMKGNLLITFATSNGEMTRTSRLNLQDGMQPKNKYALYNTNLIVEQYYDHVELSNLGF